MRGKVDITVYDPKGDLRLVVEIKSRSGRSTEWAARTLRNLLLNTAIPDAPYFLLVLPDTMFLWDGRQRSLAEDPHLSNGGPPPDYQAETADVLSGYLQESSFSLEELSEDELGMLVSSWLTEITSLALSELGTGPQLEWLFESGLYEAIRDGELTTEALV